MTRNQRRQKQQAAAAKLRAKATATAPASQAESLSMDNTKAELIKAAKAAKVKLNPRDTKADILAKMAA